MLVVPNVTMEPSNVRKKIKEPPNVMMVVVVFFLSSRSGFLGWFNGLCSFSGGFGVVIPMSETSLM